MNEEEREINEMLADAEDDWFSEQLDPRVHVVVTVEDIERAERNGTLVAEEALLRHNHVLSVRRRQIGLQVIFRDGSSTIVPWTQT